MLRSYKLHDDILNLLYLKMETSIDHLKIFIDNDVVAVGFGNNDDDDDDDGCGGGGDLVSQSK